MTMGDTMDGLLPDTNNNHNTYPLTSPTIATVHKSSGQKNEMEVERIGQKKRSDYRNRSFHFGLPLICFIVLCSIGYCWSAESRVVCYYTNWSAYRQGNAKYLARNLHPYLCTHLIYAFGGLTTDSGIKPFDKYQDIDKGGYQNFNGLKAHNKALKTLIAIGGWNEGSKRFSRLVADPDSRKNFIKLAIRFLRQHNFDGLDLDWEYPASRDGGEDEDKENYAQFIQELREAFNDESRATKRSRLLLTIAVPAGIETIDKGFDIPKINRNVDFFNLLTYDYHASTEPQANHHAPLKASQEYSDYDYKSQLNIEYTVNHYLKNGATADKLVVGLPTYGRSYTLFNADNTDVGAPASGPGTKGKYTKEVGYMAYYEICTGIKSGDWKVYNDDSDAQGPHAVHGDQWVGYDDPRISAIKGKWVRDKKLGGIMFWSLDNDDFRGECHNKSYPLIEAAKQGYYLGSTTISSLSRPGSDSSVPIPVKIPSKSSSNRLSVRFTTTKPPSTTTDTITTSRKKKPKTKSSNRDKRRRPKPRTTLTTTTSTTTPTPYTIHPFNTPEPPTTPDSGGDFECKDDGFFPNPKDCKKYFWCLDAPGLGYVAHNFVCPAGLYFNKQTDSCDYVRNVPCNADGTPITPKTTPRTTTTTTTPKPTTTTTTTTEAPEEEYEDEEEEESEEEDDVPTNSRNKADTNSGKSAKEVNDLKDLLRIIKRLGGVEELEKYLEENPSAAKAVKEFQEEDAEEQQISKKLSSAPSRFTPSPAPNRSRFSSNVSRPPLKYSSIQRASRASTTTTTPAPVKKSSEAEYTYEEVDEDDDEDREDEEDSKPSPVVPRFKPKPREIKEYVTLSRDKKTSSTETSVVVRFSDDEKLIENDSFNNARTSERPYVTSRPYAKVNGASQVEESDVSSNRLRYTSLSRRPFVAAASKNTETAGKKSSDANNGAEEVDEEPKPKPVNTSEEEVTEEEDDDDESDKKSPSTTSLSTTRFTTTTASSTHITPEIIAADVSTPKPRIRIPTRKTLGFNRARLLKSTSLSSSSSTVAPTSSTTEKAVIPDNTASNRRSRAFSVSNRKNLLQQRRTSTTTTSTAAPATEDAQTQEDSTDESPAESIDEISTDHILPVTSPRVFTSTSSSPRTSRVTVQPFARTRSRQGQSQSQNQNQNFNQRQSLTQGLTEEKDSNTFVSTSNPPRTRQRQRTSTTTTTTNINNNYSTTKSTKNPVAITETTIDEYNTSNNPRQNSRNRLRRPQYVSNSNGEEFSSTTISPLNNSKFQTAIIRRRTRRPAILSTSTVTSSTVPVTTTVPTTTLKTTTPGQITSVTRYAPNIVSTTLAIGKEDDNTGTDYYYYYYEEEDEPVSSAVAAVRGQSHGQSQRQAVSVSPTTKRYIASTTPRGDDFLRTRPQTTTTATATQNQGQIPRAGPGPGPRVQQRQAAQFSKRNLDLSSDINVNVKSNNGNTNAPHNNVPAFKKINSKTGTPQTDQIYVDEEGHLYCLDKGVFAHPKSCKKFVYCVAATEEDGGEKDGIRGYIYSCPDQLTFDPVGSICNWAGPQPRNPDNSLCTE